MRARARCARDSCASGSSHASSRRRSDFARASSRRKSITRRRSSRSRASADAAHDDAEAIGGREVPQLVAVVAHAALQHVAHAAGHVVDLRADLALRADHDLRRGGRRRRAQVGDEIADREVGLVADAGDRRDLARGHRARDDFLVERPEILERASAAARSARRRAASSARGAAARSRSRVRPSAPARARDRSAATAPRSGGRGR